MRIKSLLIICIAILFSQQTASGAQTFVNPIKHTKSGSGYYFWPIFFCGGTFFFSPDGIDMHYPGYNLSGGVTFSMYRQRYFFFTDALYSYRSYEGFPQDVHYSIEEGSADLAAGVGVDGLYAGAYIQFPVNTKLRVNEWTIDDFNGISRTPSFSLMGGMRITTKHVGIDVRLLLGQGPGQFLESSLGNHLLGQISVGVMGGF